MEYLKIKNVTSYHETEYQKVDLSKKITLIYGQNGSGKSTIANYFNHSDNDRNRYQECEFNSNKDYNYIVYNRKFIDDNFHERNKQQGIFTLSNENKEIELKINKIEIELKNKNDKYENILAQKNKLSHEAEENDLKYQDEVWEKCKEIRNSLLYELMTGYKKNKKEFFHAIKDHQKCDKINFDDLINEYNTLKNGKENSQDITNIKHPKYNENLENINTLLNESIMASSDSYLSEVISKLGNSDWVRKGMNDYLIGNACPFCQNSTIDEEFKKQLTNVFDNTYREKTHNIKKEKIAYSEKWEVYYSSVKESLDDIDTIPILPKNKKELPLHEMNNIYKENIKIFNDKISNPSNKLKINSLLDKVKIIDGYFTDTNEYINEIKEKVKKYKDSTNKIKDDSLSGMKFLSKELLKLHDNRKISLELQIKKLKLEIDNITKEKEDLSDKINTLRKKVSNIDTTIDIINNKLKYLGILDVEIEKVTESNHYCIARKSNYNKNIYHTLSEGEKTLITFLYFIEMCKGKKENSKNDKDRNLIVIDDPISSLSYNYIYDIASFIKNELFKSNKDNKIIILTHNLFFFHELIKLCPSNNKEFEKEYVVYRLYKKEKSVIEKINKNQIRNEYQMLWQTIKDIKNNKTPEIILPNIMRNILEYYFAFIHNTDVLRETLNKMSEEFGNDAYNGFYRYIARGSHSDPINIIEEFKRIGVDRYLDLFKDIFKNTNHIEHYNKMMED
ncbi:AAA family ATPase [Xenorhabdus lircayensis]|uniref:AAA family ATPase n=1 Tax=Xenorhabdus lircayensis TaxID=2763499 RepID=A0ABS0U9K5_9GAMM|nr:AAA family ATPase [Xenorhabdus lircayensis]MBI6549420.1 AAA family ATPase [Xenorhabdus lircayensis]